MRPAAILLLLITFPVAAGAQVAELGSRRAPLFAAAPVPDALADTTMHIRSTHWVTGAAIGGTALGILTGLATVELCGMEQPLDPGGVALCFVSGFVGGGLVGATIGALIGGQFPKREPWEQEAPQEP